MKISKILQELSNKLQGGSDDSEVPMAISDLKAIADMASKLAEHLMQEQPQELEGWVQAKITKAADYVSSVYKNHVYSDHDCGCGSAARGLDGNMSEATEPKLSYGDQVYSNLEILKSAATKITIKPENYSVLTDGNKFMLTTNQRAAIFAKEGTWKIIGKIDPNKNYRKQSSTLSEAKSTCCGKCGHKHIKGTSCPKPFLTGTRHCRNRE